MQHGAVHVVMAKHAQNTEPSFRDGALQYLDGLYGYAMTLTHNQAEAEDLVQDTYLRASRHKHNSQHNKHR